MLLLYVLLKHAHTVTAYTEALGCPSASTSDKLMESCFKNAKTKKLLFSRQSLISKGQPLFTAAGEEGRHKGTFQMSLIK